MSGLDDNGARVFEDEGFLFFPSLFSHGFSGIGRKRLLHILQERARALGVSLRFEHPVEDLGAYADVDLLVAADGVNSRVREAGARHFKPDIDVRRNKFIWLGTERVFDAFTFVTTQV